MGRGAKNRQEALPHMMQRLEKIREQRDELLAVLVEIVGQPNPNRYGYDAAHKAMDDDWRARARAAIAKTTGAQA